MTEQFKNLKNLLLRHSERLDVNNLNIICRSHSGQWWAIQNPLK